MIGIVFPEQVSAMHNNNSSGDKMNFFYDNIVHVQASAYAHWTTS